MTIVKDKFEIKGRRNFLRTWKVEAAISDISKISYEIFGTDGDVNSEILLKYRYFGDVTETAGPEPARLMKMSLSSK